MTKGSIEAFLAVIECGSMSSAAEKLFLSQSTLSGRIQALEKELDVLLFFRGKGIRSAELTPAGKRFIYIAEKWERLWQETLEAASGARRQTLSICSIHSISASIMSQVYQLFSAENPAIQLRLLARHSTEAHHLVESGEAEAAFVITPQFSKKLHSVPLYKEQIFFVAKNLPSSRPNPSDLDIEQEIFLNWHPGYTQWHNYWFGADSIPQVYVEDLGLMNAFLQSDHLWSTAPTLVANSLGQNSRIQIASFSSPPPERTIYMLTRNTAGMSKMLLNLLQSIKTVVVQQGVDWVYTDV